MSISLHRLVACVPKPESTPTAPLKNDPTPILVAYGPAVPLVVHGEPVLGKIDEIGQEHYSRWGAGIGRGSGAYDCRRGACAAIRRRVGFARRVRVQGPIPSSDARKRSGITQHPRTGRDRFFGGCLGSRPSGGAPDHVAALKQSIQQRMALARKYEWVETTTIILKGEEKGRKQSRCYCGADGKARRSLWTSPSRSRTQADGAVAGG